jgi:fused signal recognition particle receptor
VIALLREELVTLLADADRALSFADAPPSVWMFVGVNGVGKTTSIAKLAQRETDDGRRVVLAAADTFRAAAAEQLATWADRTGTEIVRVTGRAREGAPDEVLLVLDGTAGQNAIQQARQFLKDANVTGLVVTKLDGTAKGGAVFAIVHELGLPVKFLGVGEKADDLVPMDARAFVDGLLPAQAAPSRGV